MQDNRELASREALLVLEALVGGNWNFKVHVFSLTRKLSVDTPERPISLAVEDTCGERLAFSLLGRHSSRSSLILVH
jgi:hypothetical protein